MFMFLSLAMAKRYVELQMSLKLDLSGAARRGYAVDDLQVLMSSVQTAGR